MESYHRPKNVKEIIQKYFSEYLIEEENINFISKAHWRKIVGDKISGCTKPLYVENGILVIEVENALWNHFILLNSNKIIAATNKFNGKLFINSLKLKLTQQKKV